MTKEVLDAANALQKQIDAYNKTLNILKTPGFVDISFKNSFLPYYSHPSEINRAPDSLRELLCKWLEKELETLNAQLAKL